MEKLKLIFSIALSMTLLTACSNDDEPTSRPTLTLNGSNNATITMDYDISKTASFSFNASDNWTIDRPYGEMAIYNSSYTSREDTTGSSGTNNMTLKLLAYNTTNDVLDHYFTISSSNSLGTTDLEVTVKQDPVFEIAQTEYEANATGDTLYVDFNTDADYRYAYIAYDSSTDFAKMTGWDQESSAKSSTGHDICRKQIELQKRASTRAGSKYDYYYAIPILANSSSEQLQGDFVLFIDNPKDQNDFSCCSTWMTVNQLPSQIECSTDTVTNSGKVTTLQSHSKGNGVPFVIMGDGFIDTDVTGGNYRAATKKAMEAIFALEPMKSLREYFDVYEVTAVSLNNVFSGNTKTAFSCKYGSGTAITGNDDKVLLYAKKAVSDRIDDATILVVLNDDEYAGTTYMMSSTTSEIATGYSIAYIPMNNETEEAYCFQTILNHEAVGHGFAKLADEYGYSENGSFTSQRSSVRKAYQTDQENGMWRNSCIYSDVTKSYWADLAADSNYSSDNLGCYEGCDTYTRGIYRSTDESIMRDNINGFTPQQRRLIYNRCMRIANGSSWSPDYDEFVSFDATSRSANAKTRALTSTSKGCLRHLAQPQILRK